jgi:DNA-binding LacI/PurR family transcriptional regulator
MFIQLQSVISSEGYYPILVPVSLRMKTKDILEEVVSSEVRALFSIHYGNAELFKLLEDFGIRVVVLNNADYQNNFYTVCSDDFQGAYEGALQLIRSGHRKISFVDYDRPDFKTCQSDRFIGFKKALDEHGLALPPAHRICVELFNGTHIQESIRTLLKSDSSLTAIFAHDDYLAAKITVVLQALGRKVPDDISIIAPGDVLDYNESFIPRISTMQIDNELLGRLAGELMISRLKNKIRENQALKIKQKFVDRGSIILRNSIQ